tara:strand:- start:48334 stop:49257 length:924 start_codon:yes stop_codon:yes gene_type:complete
MQASKSTSAFWLSAILMAASSSGLRAQLVTATAVVSNAIATVNNVSNSLPAGSNIVHGTSVVASSGSSSAMTSFGLANTGNVVEYTVAQPLQGVAPALLSTSSETILRIASPQALTGSLSVLVTSNLFSGTFAIDVGNDGSIELTGTGQLSVAVAGVLEVRVVASHGLFVPSGSLALGATVQLTFEPLANCLVRNGSGVNPEVCSCINLPVTGQLWQVDVAAAPNTVAELAFASLLPLPAIPLPFGELLIEPVDALQLPGTGNHVVGIPNDPGLVGLPVYIQAMRVNTVGAGLALELTNALKGVIGS